MYWNPYRKGVNWINPRQPLPPIGHVPQHQLPVQPLPPIGHVPQHQLPEPLPPIGQVPQHQLPEPLPPIGQAPPLPCKQGFVWREAVPGDFVCVSPQTRDETASENVLGPSRRQPGGGADGPDTCKLGFVWRETRPSDHVCVPPHRRDRAKADNRMAPYTMYYPPAAPSNGISVIETTTGFTPGAFARKALVFGTFTPNNEVSFYLYSNRHGWRDNLYHLGRYKTDANGTVNTGETHYGHPVLTGSTCTDLNILQTAPFIPVIVVDEGSGIVSNAGDVRFC